MIEVAKPIASAVVLIMFLVLPWVGLLQLASSVRVMRARGTIDRWYLLYVGIVVFGYVLAFFVGAAVGGDAAVGLDFAGAGVAVTGIALMKHRNRMFGATLGWRLSEVRNDPAQGGVVGVQFESMDHMIAEMDKDRRFIYRGIVRLAVRTNGAEAATLVMTARVGPEVLRASRLFESQEAANGAALEFREKVARLGFDVRDGLVQSPS